MTSRGGVRTGLCNRKRVADGEASEPGVDSAAREHREQRREGHCARAQELRAHRQPAILVDRESRSDRSAMPSAIPSRVLTDENDRSDWREMGYL